MSDDKTSRVVAVARGMENASDDGVQRGGLQEALEPWVGRWINHGYVIEDGVEGATITTSDVYESAPGGFFLLHTAYGRIGEFDVVARRSSDTTLPLADMSRTSSTVKAMS